MRHPLIVSYPVRSVDLTLKKHIIEPRNERGKLKQRADVATGSSDGTERTSGTYVLQTCVQVCENTGTGRYDENWFTILLGKVGCKYAD